MTEDKCSCQENEEVEEAEAKEYVVKVHPIEGYVLTYDHIVANRINGDYIQLMQEENGVIANFLINMRLIRLIEIRER